MPLIQDDYYQNVEDFINSSMGVGLAKEGYDPHHFYFVDCAHDVYERYNSAVHDKAVEIWYDTLLDKESTLHNLSNNPPGTAQNIITFGQALKKWESNVQAAESDLSQHRSAVEDMNGGYHYNAYPTAIHEKAVEELKKENPDFGFDYDILMNRPDAAKLVTIGANSLDVINKYEKILDKETKRHQADTVYAKAYGKQIEVKKPEDMLEEKLPGITEIYKEAVQERCAMQENRRQQLLEKRLDEKTQKHEHKNSQSIGR